ncbi:MAG TPA: CopG family antitoxin, partial [Pyrinomonadaceae bacterium]|nr:CopG family antitoxin [Pyrinomonadaceae bacterium]
IKKSAGVMSENKKKKTTSISKAQTLEEIGEFWDIHSLDDYWNKTHEVEFEVRAKRRKRVTVDPQIYEQLEAEARLRGVVPETLVNLWLAEKLQSSK